MTKIISTAGCRNAAQHLETSFDWTTSPEGDDFWSAIHNRFCGWGRGNDFDEHVLVEYSVRVPGTLKTKKAEMPPSAVDPEKSPLVLSLREHVAAQEVEIKRLDDLIREFGEERMKFKQRLLAADFATMGR
jgi:hypothetical protein